MKRLVALVAMMLLYGALRAPCAVIHVPDDELTISAAVTSAGTGDTVLVAAGTYNDDSIWMKDGICLMSETGQADCVTIDAQFQGRIFYCYDIGSDASITGFTMTLGHGAILCQGDSSPTIRNCTFIGNGTQGQEGGAIHCVSGAAPLLEDCSFIENMSLYGGAAACTDTSSPTFTGCVFSGNTTGLGYGGAVYCDDGSDAAFIGCEFTGNEAQKGGGLYLSGASGPEFTDCSFSGNSANSGGAIDCYHAFPIITDCSFSGNTALYGGGALDCYISGPELTGCVFTGNSATRGGAASFSNCNPRVIVNCTFTENTASGRGGAVYCGYSRAWLTNCTVTGNHAGDDGAGVFCSGESLPKLRHTIVAFNTGGAGVACDESSGATATCSDIFGNTGGDWVGCVAAQYGVDGNICEDPLFCGSDNQQEPFTLHSNSPCAAEFNPECGLVGAWDVGCGSTVVTATSWGALKAMYR